MTRSTANRPGVTGLGRAFCFGVGAVTTGLLLFAIPGASAEQATTRQANSTRPGAQVPTPAEQGGTVAGVCGWGWVCGRIYNRTSRAVVITDDWNRRGDWQSHHNLEPGRNSRDVGVLDADGFWVPAGCILTAAWVRDIPGPRWEKVFDGQYFQITGAQC